MEAVTSIINILKTLLTFGGIGYAVYNGFIVFANFKEHNGPEMKNGIMGVIGGAGIMAVAQLLGQIDFSKLG